ncbi:MAG: CPBP family intramembrane glutamic endopeptidase [Candidatus Sulfotelmatobacter sp.]|jgi:membrane protease YdiL (CAAX protease family)
MGHPANSSLLITHLLAFFLVVVGPVWDYIDTRSLKAHPSPQLRLRYYRQTFVWLWIAAGVACWVSGVGALLTTRGIGIHAAWMERHGWAWWLAVVLVSLVVLLQLVLPVIQVSVKYRNRAFLEPRQLELLRFFLPSSDLERRWFAALSVTAGLCEELLFRGFLLRYLHTSPLHLGLVWAALAAALVFGTHHIYQGVKGFISTSIGGLIFTAILLVTGSLRAGMVYHAASDLSVLLYWRPKPVASDAA